MKWYANRDQEVLVHLETASIGIACMCKAGTDAPSFGEFLTLPEQKECLSCPPSNHTSSSPSGNSSLPSCPSGRSIIRWVVTGGVSLTEWSSRSWSRSRWEGQHQRRPRTIDG